MAKRRAWGSIVFRDGRAYAKVHVDGKRTHRLLLSEDDEPCTTLAEAEPAMERLRQDLEDERAMRAGERARLGDWLDDEYAGILRSRLTPRAAHQHERYLVRFAEWAEEELGEGVFMDEIGRADAERFVADFLGGDVPPPVGRKDRKRPTASRPAHKASYARRVCNVLRHAWVDAEARGLVAQNPWRRLKLPRIEPTQVPWIEPTDLRAILAAADAPYRPLLTLLAESGLRFGEAMALRRDDVDLARGVLHVRRGKTPAARRTVPVTPLLAETVRALRTRKDGRLLEPRAEQVAISALSRACDHCRLPRLTLHQLRHVYASHLVVAGCPPTVVAALLGHADGGALVLSLYGRWYPVDAQVRAVQAMTDFRATRGSPPASPGTPDPPSGRAGGAPRATRRSGRSSRRS